MTLIYRTQKGAPLTIEEVDDNFKNLATRLEALEAKSFEERSISQITLEGDELVIHSILGETLGRITIPTHALMDVAYGSLSKTMLSMILPTVKFHSVCALSLMSVKSLIKKAFIGSFY